ncbi:MAG: type II toxin-antitoxin system VapB family antitoxin [Ideonella sp.]|nr:type II toxin-antitoxin system VapB family antitoxin [Ideonella sp.]
MRTTITLDDALLEAATAAMNGSDRSTVLHEGLRLIVQREAARRLALLGGSDATAAAAPRRRPRPAATRRRGRLHGAK